MSKTSTVGTNITVHLSIAINKAGSRPHNHNSTRIGTLVPKLFICVAYLQAFIIIWIKKNEIQTFSYKKIMQ